MNAVWFFGLFFFCSQSEQGGFDAGYGRLALLIPPHPAAPTEHRVEETQTTRGDTGSTSHSSFFISWFFSCLHAPKGTMCLRFPLPSLENIKAQPCTQQRLEQPSLLLSKVNNDFD